MGFWNRCTELEYPSGPLGGNKIAMLDGLDLRGNWSETFAKGFQKVGCEIQLADLIAEFPLTGSREHCASLALVCRVM